MICSKYFSISRSHDTMQAAWKLSFNRYQGSRMKKYFCPMVLGWMVLVSKAQGQETARQDAIQGYQFYLSKNYAYAEIYFRAAVRLDPRYASGYQALGNIYVFEGRKAEAVAEYQQALAL